MKGRIRDGKEKMRKKAELSELLKVNSRADKQVNRWIKQEINTTEKKKKTTKNKRIKKAAVCLQLHRELIQIFSEIISYHYVITLH